VSELPSVIGRYEIVSRLGQGGMGSLYLAKDPKIGRLVAIKLVRADFDSVEARQRFAREAQSPGSAVLAAIAGRFGGDVLASDGSLDRAAAQLVREAIDLLLKKYGAKLTYRHYQPRFCV